MRYFFILLINLIVFQSVLAQTEPVINAPELIEGSINNSIIFSVSYQVNDDSTAQLSWKSDITDASFDDQEGEFFWQAEANDVGLHRVYFYLKDSTDKILTQSKTLIKISAPSAIPTIKMEPDSMDSRSFIKLLLGERYQLEFIASTRNTRNKDDVVLTYIWNNDTDLRTIDQAETHLIGNRLLLDWQPTQRQIEKKYFDLDLIAIDGTNAVNRRKYRFLLQGQELPPKLRNNVNDTYIITADQELAIDFSVNDPNNDPIVYSVEIPVTVGAPQINENGIFSWRLSSVEMSNISSVFPLQVKLKAEEANNPDHFVEKVITILKSEKNDPPVITKISNLSVREGYDIRRRIFIQDNNHELSDLKFSLENEPEWLYVQQEGDRLYLMSDTLSFDIVKADGIPVQFDVLFKVTDPEGASDSKFITVTVNEGVNTVKLYDQLMEYHETTDELLFGLREQIRELDNRVHRNQNLKKGMLFSTFFLGSFSAMGSFFNSYTIARQAVPYAGAMLAISSSVNALAFNQEGKVAGLKLKLEEIEKGIVRNKSYLRTYSVKDETDDELRNSELVSRVQSYRQALIEQRIELSKLEAQYRELNYVQRKIRKFNKQGKADELKWNFINSN